MALTEIRPTEAAPAPRVVVTVDRRARQPAGRVLLTVAAALVLGSLLSADSLHRLAGQQPLGSPRREISLGITGALRSVSHAVGLHLPRAWLIELTGNDDPPAASVDDLAIAPPVLSSRDGPEPDGGSFRVEPAMPTTPTTSTTVPPTTAPPTTAPPVRRTPTAEAPLRVLLAGDSLMGNISQGFGRLVRDDPRVAFSTEVHVSTGLARPDVLNWPAYLTDRLAATNPEVVILVFGANDDQPLLVPSGDVAPLASEAWRAEYARRVGQMMDLAAAGDRTVVWIGLPTVARDRLNAAKDVMNAVARAEAERRPTVTFLDTVPLFGGPEYHQTVVTPDGSEIRVRLRDGVHLTEAATDLLAPALLATFAAEWHLTSS